MLLDNQKIIKINKFIANLKENIDKRLISTISLLTYINQFEKITKFIYKNSKFLELYNDLRDDLSFENWNAIKFSMSVYALLIKVLFFKLLPS